MNLTTTPYEPQLYDRCLRLMGETWNFNELFPGLRAPNLINEFFFRDATRGVDYSQVIIDGEGAVHGYIFGVTGGKSAGGVARRLGSAAAAVRVLSRLAAGTLGPRRGALRTLGELARVTGLLESPRGENDGYVSLFLVSAVLRGQGWGKRLMGDFEASCRAKGRTGIYLWTDKGCNYGFYDRHGFDVVRQVSSPLLSHYGVEPNGFGYLKEIGPKPESPSPA